MDPNSILNGIPIKCDEQEIYREEKNNTDKKEENNTNNCLLQ